MRQTHVKISYAPWKGVDQVPAEEALQVVTVAYEINGHHVSDSVASLVLNGPFFTVRLEVPEGYPEIPEDINASNKKYLEGQLAAVRDELTEEDWLQETTDELLVLPVSSLELVERPLSFWKAA